MERSCVHCWVIENGRMCNPLTLCSVPALVHVQVCVHIPGDPQSVQLRNATTDLFDVGFFSVNFLIETKVFGFTFKMSLLLFNLVTENEEYF